MKALLLPLLLVLAATLSARSHLPDIKPRPNAKGGSNLGVKGGATVPVAMRSERVDITPSAKGVHVRASFQLENLSDENSRFEVGFPSYFQATLRDFVATVDGENQLFELVRTEKPGRRKPIFVYWLCWNMEFAPKQKREVIVEYRVDTHHFALSAADQHLPREVREQLFWHRSGYVLQTGADWAGPIGRADIYLHHSRDAPRQRTNILAPKANWKYDEKLNATVCILENFEPDRRSDVRFEFRSLPEREEIAILEGVLKESNLRPCSWQRLMELVSRSTDVAKKERDDHLLAIARKVLPLNARPPRWNRLLSRDRDAYRQGFRRYLGILYERGAKDELRLAATRQQSMLDALLEKARSRRFNRGKDALIAELEKEVAELQRRLKSAAK